MSDGVAARAHAPKRRVQRPNSADEQLAENVRTLRTKQKMSQGELATRMRDAGQAHWRQTTVSRVENMAQSVNLGEMRALEAILGTGVSRGTAWERADGLSRFTVERAAVRLGNVRRDLRRLIGTMDELRVSASELLEELERRRVE